MLDIWRNTNESQLWHLVRLQEVLEVPSPFRAAELGQVAPGVPRHAPQLVAVHPAGEAFNDGLQLFESGLRHSLRDSLRCLWPEARQDKAGLWGGHWPVVLGPPREQSVAELRPKEIHDFWCDVHRRAVLLEPVPFPGCLYTDGRPHHRLQHLQVYATGPVDRETSSVHDADPERWGDMLPRMFRSTERAAGTLWGTSLVFFGKNFSRNARRASLRFINSPSFKMIQLPSSWPNGELWWNYRTGLEKRAGISIILS